MPDEKLETLDAIAVAVGYGEGVVGQTEDESYGVFVLQALYIQGGDVPNKDNIKGLNLGLARSEAQEVWVAIGGWLFKDNETEESK